MWIICAGAKRSGSTLQYNILARLVEVSGSGVRITHFKAEEFPDIKKKFSDHSGYKVIKTHTIYNDLQNEIDNDNALVFHCYRDLRDVVVSYINKGWIGNTEDGINKCIGEYLRDMEIFEDNEIQAYSRKYEDFAFNIESELKRYGDILNIQLAEDDIKSIVNELSLENVKREQDKIEESMKRESYNNVFNEETLVHEDHINDGAINQFKNFLKASQIANIEAKTYQYMNKYGYESFWPETDHFVSHSQHADDYFAWQILGKSRKGIVVEVGAFDGVHLSNSVSLEQLGWRAICVEPNPEVFEYLKRNRPNAHNFDCAIVSSEDISEIDFYSEEIGVLSGILFDEEDVKQRYENRGLQFDGPKKYKVKARTLNSILSEVTLADNRIDVISIDVEGFEIEVLKSLDLSKYSVGLFIIEANTKEEIEEIQEFFKDFDDYVNIGTNRQNIFVLNKEWSVKENLKNLDFENYCKADQVHPVNASLTIDSVPPKFRKTINFDQLTSGSKNEPDAQSKQTDNTSSLKLTHIINPVKVGPSSDLFKAQPVTFETMLRAREFAGDALDIDLVTTQYPEDHEILPKEFAIAPDLERSIMDLGNFEKHRKLPLIKDLLEKASSFSPDSDYIIYTNVDIALQPHFYLFVKQKIEEGLDAFVINRRTISSEHDLDTLAAAYSELGAKHPGYDCFVIRRNLIPKFKLGTISIGANWIGRTMFANLIAYCDSFELFKDEHLTFHIGEDGAWLVSDFSEFDKHNKRQLYDILDQLNAELTDEHKLKQLEDIRVFMDRYGSNPTAPSKPYNPSTKTKIKKRIKKAIKYVLRMK